MNNRFIDFATPIAQRLISLNACKYNLQKPFTWTSGKKSPFYLDGRILTSDPEGMLLIEQALYQITSGIEIDYIYPVPNGGLVPATLLALEREKPLLIKNSNDYYCLNTNMLRELATEIKWTIPEDICHIAGTLPLGAVLGTMCARFMKKPLIFIREEQKTHGTGSQIEGITKAGENAILINPTFTGIIDYSKQAEDALLGLFIDVIATINENINLYVKVIPKNELRDKNIVCIEDVISTGKSCLNQILDLRSYKSRVRPVSVFSYNFPNTIEKFARYELKNKCVLDFNHLLGEYEKQHIIPLSDMLSLTDWYEEVGS